MKKQEPPTIIDYIHRITIDENGKNSTYIIKLNCEIYVMTKNEANCNSIYEWVTNYVIDGLIDI